MAVAEQYLYNNPPDNRPLLEGERMDQPTFHARYEASDPGLRAELIGGIVHLMTPASDAHSGPHAAIVFWLGLFSVETPGVRARAEPTVVLGPRSEPQPDACLSLLESYGGQSRLIDGYLHGAPELMVEVAVSSHPHDLNDKKTDYEQAGVEEYLVILPEQQQVFWFLLVDGRYETIEPDADGILRSRRFPGLWLDPAALLKDNLRRVRDVAQQGLASSEHQEWAIGIQQRHEEHAGVVIAERGSADRLNHGDS